MRGTGRPNRALFGESLERALTAALTVLLFAAARPALREADQHLVILCGLRIDERRREILDEQGKIGAAAEMRSPVGADDGDVGTFREFPLSLDLRLSLGALDEA